MGYVGEAAKYARVFIVIHRCYQSGESRKVAQELNKANQGEQTAYYFTVNIK